MKQIKINELSVGDWLVPEPSKPGRYYRVEDILHTKGKLPIEVRLTRGGTWHYRSTDTVSIKG